jgi:hypothetical protein
MMALSSNEQGAYLNLRNVGAGPALIESVHVRDKVGTIDRKAMVEITYTSVYGDRWRVTSDRVVPERL